MYRLLKMFGMSVAGLGMFATVSGAIAADSARSAQGGGRVGRSGAAAITSARMPTTPALPINSVGNISHDVPTTNVSPIQPTQPAEPSNPGDQGACADGGVRNSEYTIDNCMNDVLLCVNGGALTNGINDLFNADLRHAVENGMGLCKSQIEHCVSQVRVDCKQVYNAYADVWIDFNTRKVQPEYYNFVLRKTGLTPNQAENTCMLLDKNTYGSSFNAVDTVGVVTAEYNKPVGPYNNQTDNIGYVAIKKNPQGVTVNAGPSNGGVDGQRGHYARWDAATATCYLRVAAYNKDTHIKNSWLFGAVGDDQPAEVWRAAGDTFSCNKDLFGFSLMNDTRTAAVIGVGGGTLLGAGVGAAVGHGNRAFDCSNEKHRELLMGELRANGSIGILNEYLKNKVPNSGALSVPSCQEIVNLYDRYNHVSVAASGCGTVNVYVDLSLTCNGAGNNGPTEDEVKKCYEQHQDTIPQLKKCIDGRVWDIKMCMEKVTASIKKEAEEAGCKFSSLKNFDMKSIFCNDATNCADDINNEIVSLGKVFTLDVSGLILNGEKQNIGKTIGIGAAVGAGTGGVATAITAFIERNNITCRVGDNLAQVGFGKSYSIGSLKDFYVKWDLHLPDTVNPTPLISDCGAWRNACSKFTDSKQCAAAQLNYKKADSQEIKLITDACVMSGGTCIENYSVAQSNGACK